MMHRFDKKVDCRVSDGGNKGKKRVCFASEAQVCFDDILTGGMSEKERFQGWWQHDEYEGTKASVRNMCRKMRRITGSPGDTCLSNAYERACLIAASGVDLEAVQAKQALVPNESLVQYCRTNASRGLERWLCRSYAVSRAKRLNDAKHAVLLEQARQFLANERDEEALARVAQQASRKGRAFAALIGQADAAAAKLDDLTRQIKRNGPVQDYSQEDPILDHSSQEEKTAARIFISIQTLA